MSTQQIPVHRATVGVIALVCLVVSAGLFAVTYSSPDQGGLVFLWGALARVGILMGAVWLVLPGQGQVPAWASLSPKTLVVLLLAAVLSTRIRPHILIPAALVVGVLVLVLRPRPKHRPSDR